MVYGDVIMIDMEQMKIKLSVGAKCEDMSIGQISDFNVVGDIVIGDDDIAVNGICIARMQNAKRKEIQCNNSQKSIF